MNKSHLIQVFEHSRLDVDEVRFKTHHFQQLVRYNETHGNRFFEVGNGRIYFKSFVGVVQVGNLIIEILPKADRNPENVATKQKWQNALMRMLYACGYLPLESLSEAALRLHRSSLLDLYYQSFLDEVASLLHRGLVKQYRREQGQVNCLKGRLIVHRQIQLNSIHRERFFTEHTVYDRDHRIHQILKKALHVLADTSSSQSMIQQIRRQLLDFENIGCFEPTLADFERIRPSRKTEPYRKALLLAKMILLHFVPDVQQGRDHVLAILFDMNLLFERYVYRQLQKHHDVDPNYEVSFSAQESKDFWGRQTIRPDIIATITHLLSKVSNTFIIDTKWKILSDLRPADTDLKQMFAYNLHWKSTHAILLYPSVGQANTARIRYSQADAAPDFEHHCALCFADLVNSDGVLKKGFGRDFILENLLLGRE